MARKPPDVRVLHGHRVISGSELRATFVEQDDTAKNPHRLRRRILHGVVLVMLVGLIVAAIVVALAIMNGQIKIPGAERSRAAVSVCPAATYDYAPPQKVHVNIYNSTSRPGPARSVADQLAARSAAFSVQRHVPGSDYVQDGRADASVDVIITGDFKELA